MYPSEESFAAKAFFKFRTAQNSFAEKYETSKVSYKILQNSSKFSTEPLEFNTKLRKFLKCLTKPFFAVRNLKNGFVAKDSSLGYTIRIFMRLVEFFIRFL